jgi:hypothetical protein
VRTPQEAFEMPLDYEKAPAGGSVGVDRSAIVAAVEKYLASRGMGVQPAVQPAAVAASAPGSCGCSTTKTKESTVASVAAEVVDRILAGRSQTPGSGGYS